MSEQQEGNIQVEDRTTYRKLPKIPGISSYGIDQRSRAVDGGKSLETYFCAYAEGDKGAGFIRVASADLGPNLPNERVQDLVLKGLVSEILKP